MLKKYRWYIFTIMVIIGICLILYGFHFDFSNIEWITWFTFITLIYTIFRDSKERNKSIESATLSSNQLEFEKRLYDVLKVYDDLIEESSTMFFDTTLEGKILIPISTIFKFKDMPIKYKLKLGKMKNTIYYFYREVDSSHLYLDKLIDDIDDINKDLNSELRKYMDLCIEALNIDRNKYTEESAKIYVEINSKRTAINQNIIKLIDAKKDSIYKNARLCIKERMEIIRIKGL